MRLGRAGVTLARRAPATALPAACDERYDACIAALAQGTPPVGEAEAFGLCERECARSDAPGPPLKRASAIN